VSAVAPAADAPLDLAALPPLRERLIALVAADGHGRAALVHQFLLLHAWATDRAADHSPAHALHLVAVTRPRRVRVRARGRRGTWAAGGTDRTEGGADGAQ
jgi:hypothetical protein